MDELIKYILLFLGGGLINAIGIYIAYRNMKVTEKTTDANILRNLQELADKAILAQKDTVNELARQRENYDSRILELENKIRILMEGDLRIELIIGGNPKTAKSVKIENFISLPLVNTDKK